jgi:hypothetical protein
MIDDPFALLALPESGWPPDVEHIDVEHCALRCFDPASPMPLVTLLESTDPTISRSGLSIFGEIGRKSFVVLDVALKLIGHPHEMARNALMDGVMCYSGKLNASQARAVLTLVNDPFSLVREKVVIYLAYADPASLAAAIDSLEEPLRSEHRVGFEVLFSTPSDVQQRFDEAVARDDIWAAYAFASIDRMARKAMLLPLPEYTGEDFVAGGVIHHVKMLNARRIPGRRQ